MKKGFGILLIGVFILASYFMLFSGVSVSASGASPHGGKAKPSESSHSRQAVLQTATEKGSFNIVGLPYEKVQADILSGGNECNLRCKQPTAQVTSAQTAAEDNENPLGITAKSAYLTEPFSGTVLYAYNENYRAPIASMVKVMTALLAFEELEKGTMSLTDEISISESAAGMGGSQMFLEAGDRYTVEQLLKGVVVISANDAAVQLAEIICGSETAFVARMNERAAQLKLADTLYSNCTGLPSTEAQYSTARDTAVLYKELLRHKEYFNYSKIWMEDFTHPDGRVTGFVNTNKLIRFYDGCQGGKTGYTSEAKFCLTTSACRGSLTAIAVVIGADSSKTRFAEASGLLNYAFANYTNSVIAEANLPLEQTLSLPGAKQQNVQLVLPRPLCVLTKRGEKPIATVEYTLFEDITLPLAQGMAVGEAQATVNGVIVDRVPIVCTEELTKATYGDYINRILQNLIIK